MNVENEHGSEDLIDESEPASDLLSQFEDILNQIESEDDEESEEAPVDELLPERVFEQAQNIVLPDLEEHSISEELPEPEDTDNNEHISALQDDEALENAMQIEDEQPETPILHAYPEAKLSEKQLEALQKVIGPSASQVPGQMDIRLGDTGSLGKLAAQTPLKIESGNKNLVKSVFLTIFLVLIILAAGAGGFYYYWTTYATFEYEVQPVVVLKGQSVEANDFLTPGEITHGISAAMQNPELETNVGLQYVPITLSKDLRTVETAAALYILTPIEYKIHEYKEEGAALRAVDMISNVNVALGVPFKVDFVGERMPLEDYPVGDHILHLVLNDVPFEVTLRIVDTTAPRALPVDVTINIGEQVTPEQFVSDVYDASGINSITFALEPDVNLPQNQDVVIAIDDIYGNRSEFRAELHVVLNQDPPMIWGVPEEIISRVGEEVDYFPLDLEITAEDDFGRPVEVSVDDTAVDRDVEGMYEAVYFAEDNSGLRSEVTVIVHIICTNPEDVIRQVDEILNRITNDRMTQAQKVLAIMNEIRFGLNLRESTDGAPSDSVYAGAAKAINDRRGDSSVFASLVELMLTQAGIPNMRIDRVASAETPHSWNLVNADNRGWHHFDAFPNGLDMNSQRRSSFTETEAKSRSQSIQRAGGPADYYKYDTEAGIYPQIAE